MKTTMFDPPLAGAVLKLLVDAFDLRGEDELDALRGTNPSRYLRGDRVSPEAAAAVHVGVASALVAAGVLPRTLELGAVLPDAPAEREAPTTAVVACVIAQYAREWDELAGALHRLSAPVAFPGHAAGACLRLVAIDLAVRTAAVLWLLRAEEERPLPDFWFKPNGVSGWLRGLAKRANLSRDRLATKTGLPPTTVDDWLDRDARPESANLLRLATALASSGVGTKEVLVQQLQLAYAARYVFNAIEGAVGRPQALGMCERLVVFANELLTFPRVSGQSRDENDAKMKLALVFGTLGRDRLEMKWVASMLNHLWRNEHNPVWRTSLRAATGSWFLHLQDITAKLGPVDRAELGAALGREPTDNDLHALAFQVQASKEELERQPGFANAAASMVALGGDVAALELKLRAREAYAAGDLVGSIALLRAAIEEEPASAEIHFYLGCSLSQLGDVKEGLAELEIAVQLEPTWDRARVEVAIVLLNEGRDDEALERLLAASAAVSPPSTWVLLHLGYAHERAVQDSEAVAVYEELLVLEPQHGEVLDRIAHLYFVLGDKRAAADRAKRAAHQGIPTVFKAWESGHYDAGGPYDRPPHVGLDGLLQCPDSAWAKRAKR